MKGIANLTCKKCGAVLHKTIFGATEDDILKKNIICRCGEENGTHRCIPNNLWKTVINLSIKGYKVLNVYPKVLCIEFNGKFLKHEYLENLKLPHEFTIDITEEHDLIYNERMQKNDFVDIDEDEYIEKACLELESFVDNLPSVGVGFIFNLDIKEEDNQWGESND